MNFTAVGADYLGSWNGLVLVLSELGWRHSRRARIDRRRFGLEAFVHDNPVNLGVNHWHNPRLEPILNIHADALTTGIVSIRARHRPCSCWPSCAADLARLSLIRDA